MPTIAQLKKEVKKLSFVSEIESRGFSLGPNGFWFYRSRNEILDIIDIYVASSGNWASIRVSPFIKKNLNHCDMSLFPKGFMKGLSDPYVKYKTEEGVEHPWHKWPVKDEVSIKESFGLILKIFNEQADDWFKSIDTVEKSRDLYA